MSNKVKIRYVLGDNNFNVYRSNVELIINLSRYLFSFSVFIHIRKDKYECTLRYLLLKQKFLSKGKLS